MVSAYSSINTAGDSMTIILVNRDQNTVINTTVTVNGFTISGTSFPTLQLDNLQNGQETFKSHTDNALKAGTVTTSGNTFSLDLPTISVTAVVLTGKTPIINSATPLVNHISLRRAGKRLLVRSGAPVENAEIAIYDCTGRRTRVWRVKNLVTERLDLGGLAAGRYIVAVNRRVIGRPVVIME
jgi:archaellum component FlaF (FlaF/FlaG flagellin family)